MLVLNCPEDFQEKYENYSVSDIIKRVPKKKTSSQKKNEKEIKVEDKNKIEESDGFSNIEENLDLDIYEDEDDKLNERKSSGIIKKIKTKVTRAFIEEKINILPKNTFVYKNSSKNFSLKDIQLNEIDTKNNIKFIKKFFYKLNQFEDNLVNLILYEYLLRISEEIKKENKSYYEKAKEYVNKKKNNTDLIYSEMHYENFIYILCCVITYYTKLKVRLDFGGDYGKLFIIIHGTEEIYEKLAAIMHYQLQLKPYAYKYEIYAYEYKKKKDEKNSTQFKKDLEDEEKEIEEEEENFLKVNKDTLTTAIQFEELPDNIPYYHPPYEIYEQKNEMKYRRYEKNDLYHECQGVNDEIGENCKNCSKFRNIDKLRLITLSIDRLLRINYLKKQDVLDKIIYQRNYESYGNMLDICNLYKESWNFYNITSIKYLCNLIKNFFGENISYYYLWITYYVRWLVIPSLSGIVFLILKAFLPYAAEPKRIGKSPINYLDILMFVFCGFLSVWLTLFCKSWKKEETLYSFYWGTENYTKNELDLESFKPDFQTEFVFGEKLKFIKESKKKLKQFISYLVLIGMMIITIGITISLLFIKQQILGYSSTKNMNENEENEEEYDFWNGTLISVIFAALNALQIKLMNILYTWVAKKLNKWENYQKEYESMKDLIIKLILFEFMNSYSACFYIGFVKPQTGQKCVGTCIHEIEIQLYTTYAVFFALNGIELGIPYIIFKWRHYNYKKNVKKYLIENQPNLTEEELDNQAEEYTKCEYQSTLHQYLVDDAEKLIYEYNEILTLFGYVCLFSSTAPLSPLIVLFLVWTEKFVDLLKMFKLERFDTLDFATGIGIYNNLMRALVFIGMVTNIGVVLFSKEMAKDNDGYYKVVIFLCIENLLILLNYIFDYNPLPLWFNHLQELKELYIVKYFIRKPENLPHLKFVDKNEKRLSAKTFK